MTTSIDNIDNIDNFKDKIYLGDCYELIKKIPDKSIDLVYTDVPYLIVGGGSGGCFGVEHRSYHNEYKHLGKEEHATEGIRIGNRDNRDNDKNCVCVGFDYSLLEQLDRVMKKINIYLWCSKAQVSTLMKYYEDKGCNVDLLVFYKTNPIPTCNNKYLSDLEYCVFAREPGTPLGGTYATKSKVFMSTCNKADKEEYEHSTIKPIEMVKNHLINSSSPGDLVLDPFLGSGTTAAAAKELGRNYIGFEIEEHWYNVAKDRLDGWNQKGEMNLLYYEDE